MPDYDLPPFQDLWFEALGHQYLPADAPSPGVCCCCGAEGPVFPRAAEVLCASCWTLGAKKPMQSKSVNAGPNGSHVVIASRSGLRYWGDLKPLQPLPGTVAIQPATNIDVLMADFVLHPPTQPTYFVQLEQAYREVVRSCRPTISARAVHLNGGKPLCVDARAIRAVLTAFGDAMPESRELAPLAAARVQLGKGPLAGDPFTHAKAVLASWHLRYPALADLFPERSAWLIEPSSDSWPVLATCLRQIQRGGVSL